MSDGGVKRGSLNESKNKERTICQLASTKSEELEAVVRDDEGGEEDRSTTLRVFERRFGYISDLFLSDEDKRDLGLTD